MVAMSEISLIVLVKLGDVCSSFVIRYIRRFRHAPATQRSEREKPRETFWWKQTPTTQDHLTPPKQPQGHSTPTSNSRKVRVLKNIITLTVTACVVAL